MHKFLTEVLCITAHTVREKCDLVMEFGRNISSYSNTALSRIHFVFNEFVFEIVAIFPTKDGIHVFS